MTEQIQTPPAGDPPAPPASAQLPDGDMRALVARLEATIASRFDELEERSRKILDVPSPAIRRAAAGELMGRWTKVALASLAGDRVPELELRALDDVVTTDNLGVVPTNVRSELIGIIDPARPFLTAMRQVDPGSTGTKQQFPKLTQRPTTAVQAAEKDELSSQKTIIGIVDFDVVTIGGAGDLSLQLLKRSSPAFLQLWLELLAESYAISADAEGVAALLADAAVNEGTGDFVPGTFLFGEAFTNAAAASPSLQLRPGSDAAVYGRIRRDDGRADADRRRRDADVPWPGSARRDHRERPGRRALPAARPSGPGPSARRVGRRRRPGAVARFRVGGRWHLPAPGGRTVEGRPRRRPGGHDLVHAGLP